MRVSVTKVAVLAAAALVLASCAMPADDPNFAAGAEAGVVDPSAAAANAADQAAMSDALAAPTSIGVDAPLTAAPAKGATIVSLTDGSEYEGVFETSLAEAGTVLGWTVESVTVDALDVAGVETAINDAVGKKVAGIHITGAQASALNDAASTALTDAEAAGVPVICTGCSSSEGDAADAAAGDAMASSAASTQASAAPSAQASALGDSTAVGAAIPGITDVSIDGTAQNKDWGRILASYVVSHQDAGEGAGVQMFSLPGGAVTDFNLEFAANLLDQCRDCSSSESIVDSSVTDLTDPAAVAEFVSSEMQTALGTWALFDSGSFSTGIADSLSQDPMLLSPIVVIGRGASAADIASIQAGAGSAPAASAEAGAAPSAEASPAASAEASAAASGDAAAGRTPEQAAGLQAWIAIPQPVMAWRVVDQFARIIGGDAPATGPLPSQLLSGENVAAATLDANGNYIGIADYQDQFKALWGVK